MPDSTATPPAAAAADPAIDWAPHVLDDDRTRRLLAVHRQVNRGLAPSDMLRWLVLYLADILTVKAALLQKRDGVWVRVAESAADPALPPARAAAWRDFDRVAGALGGGVEVWRHADTEWTIVGVRTRGDVPVMLVLEANWTLSGATLLQLADNLLMAERLLTQSAQARLALVTHKLTRALGRTPGEREVCEVVLRHVVRAVPCRIAAFAVPGDDDRLTIVATHGYPRDLVEDVRIEKGVGVLGSVYQSRALLRVADAAARPGARQPRARYRTRSFLAVPVVAGSDVLGVVSLTDRIGDGPFTKDDASILRAMMAPVSLALARERQRRHADAYALAAAIDPLSGLYNRRYFQGRLEQEFERARRTDTPVALLMIDIDDFKQVNDRDGHLAGDLVIAGVADILRHAVRVFDVCARYGGEEFAVLMPSHRVEHAVSTAERIRERIEAYRPSDPALGELRVTASIGLAVVRSTSSPRELVERADRALYLAKRSGKNRLQVSE